jgi:hypothetical protein
VIRETPTQRGLRSEVRAYLARFMNREVRARLIEGGDASPLYLELIRKMGRDGWLGVALPKEYGGRGLSPLEQFIFFNEIRRANAPFNLVTVNTVAPALVAMGTADQKARFLPRIVSGELQVSIGYTERLRSERQSRHIQTAVESTVKSEISRRGDNRRVRCSERLEVLHHLVVARRMIIATNAERTVKRVSAVAAALETLVAISRGHVEVTAALVACGVGNQRPAEPQRSGASRHIHVPRLRVAPGCRPLRQLEHPVHRAIRHRVGQKRPATMSGIHHSVKRKLLSLTFVDAGHNPTPTDYLVENQTIYSTADPLCRAVLHANCGVVDACEREIGR